MVGILKSQAGPRDPWHRVAASSEPHFTSKLQLDFYELNRLAIILTRFAMTWDQPYVITQSTEEDLQVSWVLP